MEAPDPNKSTHGVTDITDVTDVKFSRDPGLVVVPISIENHGRHRKALTS